MDQISELQMEQAVEHLLKAVNLFDSIEKEHLEEIYNLSEEENVLEECIAELAPTGEMPQEQLETVDFQKDNMLETDEKPEKYLLTFKDFDATELFCKKSPSVVPGMLYKASGNYFLVTDLSMLEDKEKKNFLLLASEYTDGIQKDYFTSDYLEEHGDVIIADTPVQILKYL